MLITLMRGYVMRVSLVLMVYAALVLVAGGYAFVSAPAEANRTTAVMVPGVIAVISGVMARFWWTAPRNASRRRWPTVLLCLGFAALVAFPAVMRTGKMRQWPAASVAWDAAVQADPGLAERARAGREERKAFFAERGSPDHDQTYLMITLWSLTVLSVAAAGLVVISRR